jgi:pyruvate dehydrogenase E2 component (dihydrolipoamide acetyltransferase)
VTATAPSRELTPHRDVTVDAVGHSLVVEVKYGDLRWRLSGDAAAAPDPVSSFLGALGGCLLMSLRVAARVRKIDLGRSSVHAQANEKGHVKEIKVELQVESNASDDQLHRLVEVAERGCHIRNLVRDDVAFALTVTRI